MTNEGKPMIHSAGDDEIDAVFDRVVPWVLAVMVALTIGGCWRYARR
jgi:hypothetical protein